MTFERRRLYRSGVHSSLLSNGPGRAIAVLLLVWTSGAACLLYCATACTAVMVEASASCAVSEEMAASDCCRTEEEATTAEVVVTDGPALRGEPAAMVCCLLSSRSLEPAPVPAGAETPVAVPAMRPAPVAESAAFATVAPVRAGPVLNRGDTYLRCCVLLN